MLSEIQLLKISLMTNGIEISEEAVDYLCKCNGSRGFALSDYATTSGITIRVESDIWVNVPLKSYNSNFVKETPYRLELEGGRLWVISNNLRIQVEPVPTPSYHDEKDYDGVARTSYAITHADRVRISPIEGCSFSCAFCDSSFKYTYRKKPLELMIDAIKRAVEDPALPAHHILISGGTPKPHDYGYLKDVYRRVVESFPTLNVDVMMVPVPGLLDPLELYDAGVHGLAINIELFNTEIAEKVMPQKAHISRKHWLETIENSVKIFGPGKIRSLLVVGLEPMEDTIRGVKQLAQIGCEPVLSPFRPDPSTPLRDLSPADEHFLRETYERCAEIVDQFGVKLGPRCIPCQHNTLTYPDGSDYYYYS